MNHWVLKGAGIALVSTMTAAGAAKTAPKEVENALRARVAQFYQLMVDKKFRAAEDLVAPESRDGYYADEKPVIEDFHVNAITWDDHFTTANLTMVSKAKIRNPRIGEYEQNVPYASHWKLEGGQWYWYIPKVSARETPFGVMKADPATAEKSGLDLHAMIAKGPTPKDVLEGVTADRSDVRMIGNKSQEVDLANKLPGRIRLSAQIVSGAGFAVALKDSSLGGSGNTKLVISRLRGVEFKPGSVAVVVSPTGQILKFAVN